MTLFAEVAVDGRRQCIRCREWKPVEEFPLRRKGWHVRQSHCRSCRNEIHREWRASKGAEWQAREARRKEGYRSPVKNRVYRLSALYQLEPGDYERMLEEQGGVCALCGTDDPGTRPNKEGARHFCVDHDHKTGKVRGLLCMRCNVTVGRMEQVVPGLDRLLEWIS